MFEKVMINSVRKGMKRTCAHIYEMLRGLETGFKAFFAHRFTILVCYKCKCLAITVPDKRSSSSSFHTLMASNWKHCLENEKNKKL